MARPAGQAQKEFYVNEAHVLVDALLHCVVEGVATVPPAAPIDGTAWLVGATPTGAWAGQAGKIAARQAGNWLFILPRDGLRVMDRSTGQDTRYLGGWQRPTRPGLPSGGATIDNEARVAISQLVSALSIAGIFST
ncbi:MAG: DUF2793 domain-containing protein [Sphingomonadales bacterium]|nr:DUF2793 domain-containing protein [Sphingomonadales bacterium]